MLLRSGSMSLRDGSKRYARFKCSMSLRDGSMLCVGVLPAAKQLYTPEGPHPREARSTALQAPYSVTAFRMPLRMPFSSLPKAFTLSNTPSFMPLAM